MSKKELKKEIQLLRDAIEHISLGKWICTEHVKPQTYDYIEVLFLDRNETYKAKIDIYENELWWFIATDKEATHILLPLKNTLWRPIEDEQN